jgi:hypothetical protein
VRRATRRDDAVMSTDRRADVAAIDELKSRYCHAVDRKRWDDLASVFTPDAELHKVVDGVAAVTRSRDTIVGTISTNLATMPTMHYATNPLVTFTGPDEAEGSWCALYMNGETGSTGHGWYDDRVVRVDGTWRIARLTLTINFFR